MTKDEQEALGLNLQAIKMIKNLMILKRRFYI